MKSDNSIEEVFERISDTILHNRIEEYHFLRNRIANEEDGQVLIDLQNGLRGLEEQILQQVGSRMKANDMRKMYARKG